MKLIKKLTIITILFALTFSFGCASVEKRKGTLITPFEPLPANVVAYEGRGVSTKKSIRIAMDEAYAQAMRNMAFEIFRLVSTDIREITSNKQEQELMVNVLNEIVVRLPLPGKVFREDRVRGKEYWVRIYMSKAELDRNIGEKLIQMSRNLLEAVEEKLREQIKEANMRVDGELMLLSEFNRNQSLISKEDKG